MFLIKSPRKLLVVLGICIVVYFSLLVFINFHGQIYGETVGQGKHINMQVNLKSTLHMKKSDFPFIGFDKKPNITLQQQNLQIRAKITEKSVSKQTSTSINSIQHNVTTSNKQQQCVIPDLEAFHPDVLTHLEYLEKQKNCQTKFARVEENVLYLNISNVQDAYFTYIKRKTDFINENSKDIDLMDRVLLKFGNNGCLELTNMRSIIMTNNRDDVEYNGTDPTELVKIVIDGLSRQKKCSSLAYFHITHDGKIVHQMSKRCWISQGERIDNLNNEIILSKEHQCNESQTTFKILGQRILQHVSSGLCINVNLMKRSLFLDDCQKVRFGLGMHESIGRKLHTKRELTGEFVHLHLRINHTWYNEFHAAIQKPKLSNLTTNPNHFNIIMFMIDSISNANFQRQMNKTYKYLTDDADTVILQGHTIVGDGTTAQLTAMLTGLPEQELPEARRSFGSSQTVDQWPFIFKDFRNHSYYTLFSEDDPVVNTFNFRLKGFDKPPTSHYLRPLWIEMEEKMRNEEISYPHEFILDYLQKFYKTLKSDKKFTFTIVSRLAHDNMNRLGLIDYDLFKFLNFLETDQHRENTIIMLFGDHGARASDFRRTLQGKLEERLPFFSISLPRHFKLSNPEEYQHLQNNAKLLTSHFDIYETLLHLLSLPEHQPSKNKFGRSLFTDISSLNRTCSMAGVDLHWCPCVSYEQLSTDNVLALEIATHAVDYINQLLRNSLKAYKECSELKLHEIIKASKQEANSHIQRFNGTVKNELCDSCEVNLLEIETKQSTYEIILSVLPSHGEYEVNADVTEYLNNTKIIKILPGISRINLYGNQPSCIALAFPHLRPFCYCKNFSGKPKESVETP